MNLPRLMLCLALASCGVGTSPSIQTEPEGAAEPVSGVNALPEPAHGRVETQGAGPFLSRYAPTRGVTGTRITVLGTFAQKAEDNRVTIGGVPMAVLPNDFVLEVYVSPGAVSGPLCVTTHGQTVCGEDFTLLPGPVIHSVSPDTVRAGSTSTLRLNGEGFINGSVVLLDGLPLDTAPGPYALEATLPATLAAGTHQLSVKNGLRCGAQSLPVPFTVH